MAKSVEDVTRQVLEEENAGAEAGLVSLAVAEDAPAYGG